MTTGFILLSAIIVAIVAVLWRVWVARYAEAQRARRAEEEAIRWKRIGEGSEGVAHDVANLLSTAFFELHSLGGEGDGDPSKARASAQRVRRSLRATTELLNALRIDLDEHAEEHNLAVTTEGHVRLQVALYRRQVSIDASIQGDLAHGGSSLAASRIVQNLFHNAVREAKRAGGDVVVRLSDSAFSIRNRLRPGAVLSDEIYERGKSSEGSTGLGLALCRELAEKCGWSLSHSVEGDDVTFSCTKLPADVRASQEPGRSAALKN